MVLGYRSAVCQRPAIGDGHSVQEAFQHSGLRAFPSGMMSERQQVMTSFESISGAKT